MNIGTHHLALRKRLYENLEEYPHPNKFKRNFDYFMYVIGVVAPLALLPQVYTLFTNRSAVGFSITTWALLGTINLLWICYAILHREYPILIANTGMGILNFTMVYGILLFR